MYILYLDESGNPEDWSQNRNFVLAGVAVFEGEIQGFEASATRRRRDRPLGAAMAARVAERRRRML